MKIISTNNSKKDIFPFFKNVFDSGIFEASATLSYYFLFSVFPFFMLIATTFSKFEIDNDSVFIIMQNIMPQKLAEVLYSFIAEIKNTNLSIMLFSIYLTLYSMGKAVTTLKKKIREIFRLPNRKFRFSDIFISIFFVILMIITFYLTFFIIVVGKKLITKLQIIYKFAGEAFGSFQFIRMLITSFLVFFLIYGIYLVLPGFKFKRSDIIFGTLIATSLWIISSYLFSFYVDSMNGFSLVYGSLGAIIILLSWLYLINFAVLFGANVNAYIYHKNNGSEK